MWISKKISEISIKIGSGATPRGGKSAYKDEGMSLIRSMNVHDRKFRSKNLALIDDQQAEKLKNVELCPNDVLINITGASVARCCVVPSSFLPARVNQHVSIIRVDKDLIDPDFLCFLLTSKVYKDLLLEVGGTGATREAITKTQLQNFQISFPRCVKEQKQIVAKLDQAFTDIEKANLNAEQNLNDAKELFDSYLLKVFSQKGDGWNAYKLTDLCELISGQHIEAKNYNLDQKGIGYLTGPSDFGDINPTVTKWTEYPKKTALKGDILITVKGSGVGKVNIMQHDELAISRQLMAIRTDRVSTKLIYCFLKLNFPYFQSLANGAAIPGISRVDVLNLSISIPSGDDQVSIMKKVDELEMNIIKLKSIYIQKINALEELKQSILQKAFNGELA